MLALRSMEAMEKVADGKATKIIVPSEMQNLAATVAAIQGIAGGAPRRARQVTPGRAATPKVKRPLPAPAAAGPRGKGALLLLGNLSGDPRHRLVLRGHPRAVSGLPVQSPSKFSSSRLPSKPASAAGKAACAAARPSAGSVTAAL